MQCDEAECLLSLSDLPALRPLPPPPVHYPGKSLLSIHLGFGIWIGGHVTTAERAHAMLL